MKKKKNITSLIQASLKKRLPVLQRNLGFFVCILSLFSIRWSLADHYRVPTGSMKPSIKVGDHILVDKTAYQLKLPFTDISLKKTGTPKRGDVVVFTAPLAEQTTMVKRVIGLPGDHIKVENGFVTINGVKEVYSPSIASADNYNREALIYFKVMIRERAYAVGRDKNKMQFKKEAIEFIVPDGQYFMMGDNRDYSYDSRYWGMVPEKNLIGRAFGVALNARFEKFVPKVDLSRVGATL